MVESFEEIKAKHQKKIDHTVDTGLSLYDANKQLLRQLIEKGDEHPLNPMEQAAIQLKLEDWFNMECDNYAMLLCNELHYYTLFSMYRNTGNKNPPGAAARELMSLINDLGIVYSIEPEDKAWEIWIDVDGDDAHGDNLHAFYLFRYDKGVIEV